MLYLHFVEKISILRGNSRQLLFTHQAGNRDTSHFKYLTTRVNIGIIL